LPDNDLLKTGGTGGFAGDEDDRPRQEDGGWLPGVKFERVGEGPRSRPTDRPGERDARGADGKFRQGYSGNPVGRPKGSFRAGTRAAALLLDAQAEALAQKAIEMALDGDPVAVRFCLGRILGVRRGQPVELDLPAVSEPGDLAGAVGAIIAAVAEGAITPDEALALSQMLDGFPRIMSAGQAEPGWDMEAAAEDAREELAKWLSRLAASPESAEPDPPSGDG